MFHHLLIPRITPFLVLLCATIISCGPQSDGGSIAPRDLRCEYLPNPAVVDIPSPRLSWINASIAAGQRGLSQSAYQVRVASDRATLGSPDLWDSDKVTSNNSTRVAYQGASLNSRQECWWQVRVWDQDDNVSNWSQPAFWRMGLLDPSDWQAQWIGAPWQGEEPIPRPTGYPNERPDNFGPPAPYLRKTIELEKSVASAVIFVTGLGYFELQVNGEKVSEDLLVPNQTNYGKRPNLPSYYINLADEFRRYKVMYPAYDLKPYLREGENTLGAILGNGFYNPAKFWADGYGTPRFLAQLHVTYEDGSEQVIVSDETWKASTGPIVMDMVYYGETYDARLENDGWSTPAFDDATWKMAGLKKAPEGELVAHTAYPDRITKTLQPKSITTLDNGNYFVDFGEEISGWVRLEGVDGPEGHEIDLSFNSNLYSGDNKYICRGEGPANYAPRFNWFVFSGVEVTNWPGELRPDQIQAEAVNTYIETTATFETSNPLLNDINKIWRRSQEDNMHGGIASDCPHRERSGYTGDGQVACATVIHNYDARNFYQKWIQDMNDAQLPSTGYVPNGAPWQPGCGGGVAWGAAICIMPWEFYQHYGSIDMLEDNFEAMKGYVQYLETWRRSDGVIHSQRRNGSGEVLRWFNLGDWVAPVELPPNELVHTFYFWRCADITARVADILGEEEESARFRMMANEAAAAFHSVFYDAEVASYGNYGGNIFALRMGVPEDRRDLVINTLRENIQSNAGHFDTGIFGTRFFFEVLTQHGMHDLAYQAITKREEPSFGRWLELGATTARERWDEGGSHNHPMFGGGLVWLYRYLAGMQIDEQQPGYRRLVFKPHPVEALSHVKYENQTPYGASGISWRSTNEAFEMSVTVPVGAEATVFVPSATDQQVVVDGERQLPSDIQSAGRADNYSIFHVGSGVYHFSVDGD